MVAISADGGVTWSLHPGAGETALAGAVAYPAEADTIFRPSSNAGVLPS